ncbi:MAG: sigma-E factor negative regulatory protein [Rubrivivax sp.]
MTTHLDLFAHDRVADDQQTCLSGLADGEAAAVDAACSRWRDDPEARRTWHAYHLIGDVMRSDELATRPAHDAAFMAALRQRLAAEPVVLAPASATSASPARRQSWLLPVAAAAGFVVVAGVLVLTRPAAPDAAGGSEATASRLAIADRTVPVAPTGSSGEPLIAVSGPQQPGGGAGLRPAPLSPMPAPMLVRDARLDDYLRAHQAAGGLAAATPGGWLQRVDSRVSQPPER